MVNEPLISFHPSWHLNHVIPEHVRCANFNICFSYCSIKCFFSLFIYYFFLLLPPDGGGKKKKHETPFEKMKKKSSFIFKKREENVKHNKLLGAGGENWLEQRGI